MAGLAEFEIQLLGHWKADAYKAYIDTDPADLLCMAHRIHGLPLTGLQHVPNPVPLTFRPLDPIRILWVTFGGGGSYVHLLC
jgi:hypothetical protein